METEESPASAAVPAEFDFSRSGQRFSHFEQWRQFALAYPKRQALVVYLYRLYPRLRREQSGCKDSRIEKITAATPGVGDSGIPDLTYLANKWGSGVYHLKVNDLNKTKYSLLGQVEVEIQDPMLDPVFDPAELNLEDARNQPVVQAYLGRGYQVRDGRNDLIGSFRYLALDGGNPSSTSPAAPPAAAAPNVVLDSALIRELFARANPAPAPASIEDRVFAIAERIAGNRSAAPAADPMAELERMTRLMRAMGWQPPGAPAAALPAPAASEDSGASSVMGFLSRLPEVLREGRMLLQVMMVPGASPAAPAPAPAPGAVLDAEYDDDEDNGEGDDVALPVGVPSLQTIMRVGQELQAALQRGESGLAFAGRIASDPEKRAVWLWLKSLHRQQVVDYLMKVPAISAEVNSDPARFHLFVDQFFSFDVVQ